MAPRQALCEGIILASENREQLKEQQKETVTLHASLPPAPREKKCC